MSTPAAARRQLDVLVQGFGRIVGGECVGLYLHGSLTLGCFNPQTSDVDVVAVTRRRLTGQERRDVASLALENSAPLGGAPPWPLELTALSLGDLRPWRHPAPYDLHFSESHRHEFAAGRLLGPGENPDLAADVTAVRETGAVLAGDSVADVFPDVPWQDFADAIVADLDWCREHANELYSVLSPSRIWATLTEGRSYSKASGAAWALERAPEDFRPLIARALRLYSGEEAGTGFDRGEIRRFTDFVAAEITPSRGSDPLRQLEVERDSPENEDDPRPERGFAPREAHKQRKR